MLQTRLVLVFALFFTCITVAPSAAEEGVQEFSKAEQLFEAGDIQPAETAYRSALEKYQQMGSLAAYIENQIALCKKYQGRTEEAIEIFRQIKIKHPASPIAGQAQEQIARAYYEAGNYIKAAPEFEKMAEEIEKDPGEVRASSVQTKNRKQALMRESLGYSAFLYWKTGKQIKTFLTKQKWNKIDNTNGTNK